jgi:hypothetical protein
MYIQDHKVKKKPQETTEAGENIKKKENEGADINYNQDLGIEQPGSFYTTK